MAVCPCASRLGQSTPEGKFWRSSPLNPNWERLFCRYVSRPEADFSQMLQDDIAESHAAEEARKKDGGA